MIERQPGGVRINLKPTRQDRPGDVSSPILPTPAHTVLSSLPPLSRRSRPETSHQKAVNLNRRMHIDKILFKKWNENTGAYLRKRKYHGLNPLYFQIKRIFYLPAAYDTEDELETIGPGGITSNIYINDLIEGEEDFEDNTFGAEAHHYKKLLQRSMRRLARDDGIDFPIVGDLAPLRKPPQTNGTRSTPAAKSRSRPSTKKPEQPTIKDSPHAEDLDDLDMDLLGEGQPGMDDETMLSSGESDDGDMTEDDFAYADPYATLK